MGKDEVKKEERNIEMKINNVSRDNEQLERFIDNLDNPKFLEKEVRLRLNYKALNEKVVFVHRDLNPRKSSATEDFSVENLPNYKKWWYYLLGY